MTTTTQQKRGLKSSTLMLVLGVALVGLAGCSSEPADAGSETAPLYGGDYLSDRETFTFASGERMDCYTFSRNKKSNSSSSYERLECDWESAPRVNMRLVDQHIEDSWRLVFLDQPSGEAVCLAQDWGKKSPKTSCALNHIRR